MLDSTSTEKQGDPSKWVEKHGDVLFAFAVSKLKNRDSAEEAVQETFVGALKNLRLANREGSEGAWLMGILKNKVVDRIRENARSGLSLEGEDNVVETLFDERGNWSSSARNSASLTLDSIEQEEFREILAHCLKGLPTNQSSAFILREIQERNSVDVCKELDVSSTNLWVLMHRARLRLAECIKSRWAMGDA